MPHLPQSSDFCFQVTYAVKVFKQNSLVSQPILTGVIRSNLLQPESMAIPFCPTNQQVAGNFPQLLLASLLQHDTVHLSRRRLSYRNGMQ